MRDKPELKMGRYRVGLVGCGRQGTFFARAFAARLCDLDRMVEACDEAGAFYQAGNVDWVRP